MTDWFELAKWICVPDRRIEEDGCGLYYIEHHRIERNGQGKDGGTDAPAVPVEEKP